MSAVPSRYISGTRTRTDVVKQTVAAALERQRPGLDGLQSLRAVSIRVRLATNPAGNGAPAVSVHFETEG